MGRPSRYPDEFRREAVQMALATNDSRASVSGATLGVNETDAQEAGWLISSPKRRGKRTRCR